MKNNKFTLPQPIPLEEEPNITSQPNTAADVARQKVTKAYVQSPPNQADNKSRNTLSDASYNRTYANYDWQQYHSAWQQYYQQYYQRYYLQQLYTQRQETIAAKINEASSKEGNSTTLKSRKSQAKELRGELLKKIQQRTNTAKKSRHFVPILSGIIVAAVFLFLQYNRILVADVQAYVSPGTTINESDTILVDPTANLNVGSESKLIIPKINVNIKVVYDVTTLDESSVQDGLRKGVVHYNLPGANSLPGQVGNTVILGHSSNDIFNPGDYKFAFVLLDRLQTDDIFYIHYEGKRYIYKVAEKKIIKPSEISELKISNGKPMATLVTCTPLGTDTNRLLVIAEQISPDPSTAQIAESDAQGSSGATSVPSGSSSTLLKKIINFFF
ncbi:MAG: sortase [Candidatus Woesebacteria bacterium]|jgi:sortase A